MVIWSEPQVQPPDLTKFSHIDIQYAWSWSFRNFSLRRFADIFYRAWSFFVRIGSYRDLGIKKVLTVYWEEHFEMEIEWVLKLKSWNDSCSILNSIWISFKVPLKRTPLNINKSKCNFCKYLHKCWCNEWKFSKLLLGTYARLS